MGEHVIFPGASPNIPIEIEVKNILQNCRNRVRDKISALGNMIYVETDDLYCVQIKIQQINLSDKLLRLQNSSSLFVINRILGPERKILIFDIWGLNRKHLLKIYYLYFLRKF